MENINYIQLSVEVKSNEDENKCWKEAVEIALDFFSKCTSLSISEEDLDVEYNDDDGEVVTYLVTYSK